MAALRVRRWAVTLALPMEPGRVEKPNEDVMLGDGVNFGMIGMNLGKK